ELGLGVGARGPVGAALPVGVVEVDRADAVGEGGDGDHAAHDLRQQQVGQREVAEVVGAELELEPVGRAPQRRDHQPGVVDQQVDGAVDATGEEAHGGEVGEVEAAHLGLAGHGGGGVGPLAHIAHGQDDARAVLGEGSGGDAADAAVGTGDDRSASGEV